MTGKIHKTENGFVVKFLKEGSMTWRKGNPESLTFENKELPLHPDDVEKINKDSLIFDNIEARIATYPEVEFEIIEIDNGAMSYTESYQSTKYAKLK